jgi:predicted exporter
MTFLCLEISGKKDKIEASEVNQANDCDDGWLAVDLATYDESLFQGLTYAEAGQLLGAVALLFSVAFILRSVRKQLGF